MKQIIQSFKTGETEVADVPCPQNKAGNLLIGSVTSLVSAGTEKMLLDFGKASYINKARQQPDKVKQVLEKVKTDGLLTTFDAVRSKLDQPLPLGYCNVGIVAEIGEGVDGFEVGDRVISNGFHAEMVRVPKNLCAKIPENVDDQSAAFTVIGSIALQGVRLIKPTLGECVVVMGLGLIGLMAVQLLKANGCRVLGLDFDAEKCDLARTFGAEVVNLSSGQDPVQVAMAFSRNRGVDAVLNAVATSSDEPMHQAALMCRKRGRIVLVGVTGLNLSRDDFFKKEITFQVSSSYGPGRYDPNYEEKGQDYPVGFVRWTEQRNFEAVLDLMSEGRIDVKPLITHTFDIEEAKKAYELLGSDEKSLGILINYPVEKLEDIKIGRKVPLSDQSEAMKKSPGNIAVIGAGNYSSRVLIPAFVEAGAGLGTIVTSSGMSGVYNGKKFKFQNASTDMEETLRDDNLDTVVIATQHNTHADLVVKSLQAGKNVFVEKPLALTLEELDEIEKAYLANLDKGNNSRLMVGFNRRFAPHVQKMHSLLQATTAPKSFIYTVNAGAIPADTWVQDPKVGGGRIIGEVCHFIDLLRFLAGQEIVDYSVTTMGAVPGVEVPEDKVSITLSFRDGSFGTIHYLANGGKAFPKERVEVFVDDAVLQLNNFRSLEGYGWKGFKKEKSFSQDKGQGSCAAEFMNSVRSGSASPIPFDELMEVSRLVIEIDRAARSKAN